MADIQPLVISLISQIGIGKDSLMLPTAYDTAWVARVPSEEDRAIPAFPEALQWLRDNQLPDGSWGAEYIEYVHDRVICTLAALIALAERGQASDDTERVERGVQYIVQKASFLADEVETIGFELIVPTLLDKCRQIGLSLPQEPFARYGLMRAEKLSRVPEDMLYSKDTTLAFSLEFMGDALDPERVQQETDGSVGVSPSATAYLLMHVNNVAARRYVARVVQAYDGRAPNVAPFDVFETAWVLWNLQLAGLDLRTMATECLSGLQWLHRQQGPVGFSSHYSVPDADETAMLLSVLKSARVEIHPQVLEPFFQRSYFACYLWERNPSVSANVHALDALKGVDQEAQQVVVDYLAKQQNTEGFWVDKWHTSPYYATGHAVIALSGLDDMEHLIKPAVAWLLDTQRANGAWGHYCATAEETAYALQALVVASRQDLCPADAVWQAIGEGLAYLEPHLNDQCPPSLWIGKCLYAPVRVIQAAVLSACLMARDSLFRQEFYLPGQTTSDIQAILQLAQDGVESCT